MEAVMVAEGQCIGAIGAGGAVGQCIRAVAELSELYVVSLTVS
jgi:hypothetical protein